MGPVPEPLPGCSLSDEDMPQHPPIIISSSDEDEVDNNDYPSGYMPITQDMEWPSDDSEEEADDSAAQPSTVTAAEDTTAAPPPVIVMPSVSSSSATEAGDNSDIDYKTVAGLMQALGTHGPNVVTADCGMGQVYTDGTTAGAAGHASPGVHTANTDESPLITSTNLGKELNTLLVTDQVPPSTFNTNPLQPEQEEAVKRAMLGFSLPPSSIPAWAANVRDTDLNGILKDKLTRQS